MSGSLLRQFCNDTSDPALIENNGIALKWVETQSGATPLFSMTTVLLISWQSCRIVHSGAWCKQVLMVYSHWLSPGLGWGSGPVSGRMGCMILRRTFHIAPDQGQGRIGYVPIFQVLKLLQVVCLNDISMAFGCPVLVPDTASVNGFCII